MLRSVERPFKLSRAGARAPGDGGGRGSEGRGSPAALLLAALSGPLSSLRGSGGRGSPSALLLAALSGTMSSLCGSGGRGSPATPLLAALSGTMSSSLRLASRVPRMCRSMDAHPVESVFPRCRGSMRWRKRFTTERSVGAAFALTAPSACAARRRLTYRSRGDAVSGTYMHICTCVYIRMHTHMYVSVYTYARAARRRLTWSTSKRRRERRSCSGYICICISLSLSLSIHTHTHTHTHRDMAPSACAARMRLTWSRSRGNAVSRAGVQLIYVYMCSKGFALTWYRALTRHSSPARPFAAPDVPLLVPGRQRSPSPACRQLSRAYHVCVGGSSAESTKLGHGTKLGQTLCYVCMHTCIHTCLRREKEAHSAQEQRAEKAR